MTISNVSEKIRRQAPAIHWDGPMIDKLEDRFKLLVEMSRAKNFAQAEADLEFRLFCARLPDS